MSPFWITAKKHKLRFFWVVVWHYSGLWHVKVAIPTLMYNLLSSYHCWLIYPHGMVSSIFPIANQTMNRPVLRLHPGVFVNGSDDILSDVSHETLHGRRIPAFWVFVSLSWGLWPTNYLDEPLVAVVKISFILATCFSAATGSARISLNFKLDAGRSFILREEIPCPILSILNTNSTNQAIDQPTNPPINQPLNKPGHRIRQPGHEWIHGSGPSQLLEEFTVQPGRAIVEGLSYISVGL